MEVTRVGQRSYMKLSVLRGKNAVEYLSELVEDLENNALHYHTVGERRVKNRCGRVKFNCTRRSKNRWLKNLIVNSDVYKNDKELVQSAIDYALAEIKNKRLDSETKLEFERIKLAQLQKQLELANIQKNLPQNSDIRNPSVFETADNNNVETLLKSVKTLTIPVPSRVESYNLFFQSLEKAFKQKRFPDNLKAKFF
ncbi:integrase catalytic domain-containing protein [Trichonephila clavipes]|nr:integrase catalytic domain-containing protein [Trichonephila clavipes]